MRPVTLETFQKVIEKFDLVQVVDPEIMVDPGEPFMDVDYLEVGSNDLIAFVRLHNSGNVNYNVDTTHGVVNEVVSGVQI